METKIGFKEKPSTSNSFFRKGITDEWKNVLSEKQIKLIEENFNNEMSNKDKSSLTWEDEIEVLDAVKESEKIRENNFNEDSIEEIVKNLPELVGGSADLSGSNNTKTKHSSILKPANFNGNYIHYGVREHAMCGIMNGLSLHSGLIPYGGTFLIFSDYCKPSIRLAAMMKQRVIYIFTHDSIGLGEDGPTHQPIEQLASLRSIPNLNVFRPADTIETFECWQLALESIKSPSVIALSRQKINPVRKEYSKINKCSKGAYEVMRTGDNIKLILLSSGSETSLACEVSHKLATENIYSKVISMPCQELFDKQDETYKKQILSEAELLVSIEASETEFWKKYTGSNGMNFGIYDFGRSAPVSYTHLTLPTNREV